MLKLKIYIERIKKWYKGEPVLYLSGKSSKRLLK